MVMLLVVCAWVSVALPIESAPGLSRMPQDMVLSAPYIPFCHDGSLNVSSANVEALVANAAAFGVTTLWVPGSMAQFDTMSVAERKLVLERWVQAAHQHSMYVIAHVGSTSAMDAVELASHAAEVGADAIGAVPPFYERQFTVDTILDFLTPIVSAASALPFFYYHIPGMTGADVKMTDLFLAAAAPVNVSSGEPRMRQLAGVKFVSSDLADWLALVEQFNDTRALMFAPEPKLASFAVGAGRGTILAEDFFAQTYLRMRTAFLTGDLAAARREQTFKLKASAVLSKYGGPAAERALYRRFTITSGFDYGPGRLPLKPFDEALWPELDKELDNLGFWDQLVPKVG